MTAARGLLAPLRRDRKRDFATSDGDELLASKVMQVLATEGASLRSSGELPWRTAFGTPLHLLRHQNNDVALAELGRVYSQAARRRWLPEAEVVSVAAASDGPTLTLRLRFRASGNAPAADITVPLGA